MRLFGDTMRHVGDATPARLTGATASRQMRGGGERKRGAEAICVPSHRIHQKKSDIESPARHRRGQSLSCAPTKAGALAAAALRLPTLRPSPEHDSALTE